MNTNLPLLLITGASSGVGASLTNYFSSKFRIIAAARRTEKMKQDFKFHPNVSVEHLDVENIENLQKFIHEIEKKYGTITCAINNAGLLHREPGDHLSHLQIEKSLRVNALGPFEITKALLASMKKNNFGRVINITSGAPLNCFAEFGAYSGSKALLNALTVTLAKENEKLNIKINLMSPGPVRSEMSPNSVLDPSICHPMADYLLNLDASGPTGKFFWLGYEVPLAPNLEGVDWLRGIPSPLMKKVL